MRVSGVGLLAALSGALLLAACSTPSERYGLEPPVKTADPYPNINRDPAAKPKETAMTPQQRAEAEAELKRQAGRPQ